MTKLKVGDKEHPFKPGDKVVRIGPALSGVERGSLRTVKTVSSEEIAGELVHWVTIADCVSNHGKDFLFRTELFRHARYSEYFTVQADKSSDGGHIQGSPIQKHSKGPYYPLCVVGYSDTGRTAFTIENLEDGTVMGFAPEEFSGGSNIRAWGNSHQAYAYLDEYVNTEMRKQVFVRGRPTFIKNSYGLEVVIPPKHKRWAVQLEKLDAPADAIAINGAYYKALEQDIG